jgi:hypothetical protein
MAIIQMPDALRCGQGCRIEQVTFDVLTASDVTGSSQARPYGMPHWALSLASPEFMAEPDAAAWKAMLLSLRGSVNVLAAYDPSRTAPVGTLRGAPVLQAAAVFGDDVITLNAGGGQAGRTLEPGDWLQIGTGFGSSQLVMVRASAVLDGAGVGSVSIEAPLRREFAAGAAITWQRPRGYFRKAAGRVGWSAHCPGVTQSMAVDLVEAWA